MFADTDLWFIAAYISMFMTTALNSRRYGWLLLALLLWLAIGAAGAWLLPGILSPLRLGIWYLPQWYMLPASLVLLRDVQRLPVAGRHWQISGSRPFAALFVLSGLVMLLAHLSLLALVGWMYPQGLTPYVVPALLQLNFFEPGYWLTVQLLLMALFYLHRTVIGGRPANEFSYAQLMGSGLLLWLLQVVYVVSALLGSR